jgi:hypothetical protein
VFVLVVRAQLAMALVLVMECKYFAGEDTVLEADVMRLSMMMMW